MTTRLFVPLDGSEKDQRAIQVADAFAELIGGSVRQVRVNATPATHVSTGLAMLGDVPVSMDAPDVASELIAMAEREADVVVMATAAPGAVKRVFLGSVADEVVRKSSRPVMVVPPHARYGKESRITFRRALCPLDGSRLGMSGLERFRELAPPGKFEYVLLQAVRAERTGGHVMPEALSPSDAAAPSGVSHVQARQANAHLEELAGALRARGDRVDVRVVESTDPAAAILEAVRAELADLIVMSTHGEGGLRRVLHGSVANRVARESEVPVFLVTPRSAHQ